MSRNPHAGTPFADGDADLARMVEEMSVPALLCSLVHMTGDPSWLRRPEQPRMIMMGEFQGGMTADEQATIRAAAVPVIAAYRDGGCQPVELDSATIDEMLAFIARRPVTGEMREMVLEELQLSGVDGRAITWAEEIPASRRDESHVVIIGAGESGIVAAIRLQQAGLPFTIVEKIDGPGGVWRHNRYPGARVDVATHQYSYSFAMSDEWSEYFVRQPELQAYFERIVDDYHLGPHCRWNTEVLAATWDETRSRWSVEIGDANGEREVLDAKFVISAVGALSLPYLPALPGADDFDGPSFHSAEWPRGFSVAGKRLALIGAGATGFQIAPTVAPEVEHLSIFQRTGQWMFPNPNYHAAVPAGDRWAMTHLPFYGRWVRFMAMWPPLSIGTTPFQRDPNFDDSDNLAINAGNAQRRAMLIEWITAHVGDDPELLAKSIPNYPPSAKRMLQDNGSWLRCLRRDNVDFVRTAIDRIEPGGVRTTDGAFYPADVICYATGFRANEYLAPISFIGRGGVSIRQQWGDRPTAHLGITVPNFPNLFLLYGPGTNLAHGLSLIFHSECQTRYILDGIHQVLAAEATAIEVREEAHDEYQVRYRAAIDSLIWSHPSVEHSHYKNPEGKIYALSPWPMEEYWSLTRRLDPADYTFTSVDGGDKLRAGQ